MATLTKAWSEGTGSVYLTYGGSGNGTIVVASDANDLPTTRSMTITIKTTSGSPQVTKTVTLMQGACPYNFKTADGYFVQTADGYILNVQEES
jgi:hypothetical protein